MQEQLNNNQLTHLPNFESKVVENFERFPDGETCQLISASPSIQFSEDDFTTIATICSQPLVSKLFVGIPGFENGYTVEKARNFVEKAQKNWKENNKYVFFIRNPKGEIVACTDIKATSLDDAEIGYWASAEYPGVMANGVKALCKVAKKAGYKHLYALIRQDNDKSTKVAQNAGLKFSTQVEEDEIIYNRFDIDL